MKSDAQNSNTCKKRSQPELLAPAGSLECFHAALDAGADAVYIGIDVLNARLRARNFTIQTLSYLIPYARRHDIKVYVTLNTLVKQQELHPLLDTLYQLEQLSVNAVIIQDLGVAFLIRRHFPSLNISSISSSNCVLSIFTPRIGFPMNYFRLPRRRRRIRGGISADNKKLRQNALRHFHDFPERLLVKRPDYTRA